MMKEYRERRAAVERILREKMQKWFGFHVNNFLKLKKIYCILFLCDFTQQKMCVKLNVKINIVQFIAIFHLTFDRMMAIFDLTVLGCMDALKTESWQSLQGVR